MEERRMTDDGRACRLDIANALMADMRREHFKVPREILDFLQKWVAGEVTDPAIINSALKPWSERHGGAEWMRKRGDRADPEAVERILDKIPDVPPDEGDETT
jgi:hypothetical protein